MPELQTRQRQNSKQAAFTLRGYNLETQLWLVERVPDKTGLWGFPSGTLITESNLTMSRTQGVCWLLLSGTHSAVTKKGRMPAEACGYGKRRGRGAFGEFAGAKLLHLLH